MKKLAFTHALILFIFLSMSPVVACKKQSAPTTTVDEIAQAAVKAIAGLNTYRFDFDRIITVTSKEGQATYAIDIYGAIDEAEKEMHHNMQISGKEASGYSIESHYKMYMVGGWRYLKSDNNAWEKSQSEYYWDNYDYAGEQLDLLTMLAPEVFLNTETVNGVDCYKLKLEPDKVTLWSWIVSQAWSQVLEGHEQELTEDIVTDYSIFQWIARDTYFLVKSTVDITMTIDTHIIVYTKTVLIHHFNEPISIELPPEAEK